MQIYFLGNMRSKQNQNKQAELLHSLLFFKDVDAKTLQVLANRLVMCEFDAGEVIFEKGDIDYALYVIETGMVKAHVGFHTFATFGPSQYFGEYALFDSTPRSTTVTAIKKSKLWKLNQKDFFDVFNRDSKLALSMVKALVWRLRDYNNLEAELTEKNLEIKHQKEALEAQTTQLETLNQTKDKFFAIIAHDLKNPFSTVVSLSEMLAQEFDNFDHEKQLTFVQQIQTFSSKTYNLLENLLQWAVLQTGQQKIHIQENNIGRLIADNVDLLTGFAQNKGIALRCETHDDSLANFDYNMVNTVIRNLITNALKFTPENGQVSVTLQNLPEKWRVNVIDNGVGISETDRQKLFRIDTNPSTIGTSQERGTGLGLILCKEFIQKNGGEIGVDSQLGKGSTFWFTIPKTNKAESKN